VRVGYPARAGSSGVAMGEASGDADWAWTPDRSRPTKTAVPSAAVRAVRRVILGMRFAPVHSTEIAQTKIVTLGFSPPRALQLSEDDVYGKWSRRTWPYGE